MHGAGNDYVYVDARSVDRDWPALAEKMSDRHVGIGSDGLILADESDHADLKMTMFNADGSESGMCGNGIRCLVSFAMDNGIVSPDKSRVVVETSSRDLEVTPIFQDGTMARAVVAMGEPRFMAEEVPVVASGQNVVMDYPLEVAGHTYDISCVSMGNPHAVAFIDTPVEDVKLHEIGPLVEHHPMFPERVNFEIVNIIDTTHLKTRVWERGSGLTMACGTGACAVVVIGRTRSLTADEVKVIVPGGELEITWPGRGDVIMEGPIEHVFDGDWPE